MAIIQCPECGKEVSDKAGNCPHCGFGVKQYMEDEEKERKKQKDLEYKIEKYQMEVTMPVPPVKRFSDHEEWQIFCGLVSAVISVGGVIFILIVSREYSDFASTAAFELILGIVFGGVGIALIKSAFNSRDERFRREQAVYSGAKANFEAYKKQLVSDKIAHDEFLEKYKSANKIRAQAHIPKCPICGSTNLKKISIFAWAFNTALFGEIGALNVAGKTWQCKNCDSRF